MFGGFIRKQAVLRQNSAYVFRMALLLAGILLVALALPGSPVPATADYATLSDHGGFVVNGIAFAYLGVRGPDHCRCRSIQLPVDGVAITPSTGNGGERFIERAGGMEYSWLEAAIPERGWKIGEIFLEETFGGRLQSFKHGAASTWPRGARIHMDASRALLTLRAGVIQLAVPRVGLSRWAEEENWIAARGVLDSDSHAKFRCPDCLKGRGVSEL